jgi:hypothetical protein
MILAPPRNRGCPRSLALGDLGYGANKAGCPILATYLFLSLGWDTSTLDTPVSLQESFLTLFNPRRKA